VKRTHLLSALAACAVLALAVAGCGGDDNSSDTGGGTATETTDAQTPAQTTGDTNAPAPGSGEGATLKISADPSGQLKFDTDSLTAKAGKVTITMDNPSSVPHAVGVDGNGVDEDGETVQQGGKSTVSVDLKPGKYTFYCPVDGHEDAGMKGTLTVK
jgi:plastocyanin